MKMPTAYLPLAMSLTSLAIVLIHFAIYGIVHEADEGAAAHVVQILMVTQVPIVAFFAIKWLPQAPGAALKVLGVQILAGLAVVASIYFLT